MDPYHLVGSGSVSDDTDPNPNPCIAPKLTYTMPKKIRLVRKYMMKNNCFNIFIFLLYFFLHFGLYSKYVSLVYINNKLNKTRKSKIHIVKVTQDLDPHPDPYQNETDPKHCFLFNHTSFCLYLSLDLQQFLDSVSASAQRRSLMAPDFLPCQDHISKDEVKIVNSFFQCCESVSS